MTGGARALWNRLGSTLWFVPGAIALAMAGLAVAMIQLSALVDDEVLRRFPRVFGASAESSRAILTAVAGATITVAGLTFSLTMVAVTQVSSQYTPRILGNFMRDRASQAVLGLYVGIFTYCLLVARTIRSGEEGRFLPSLAVVLGIALAIAGMGALIFFVHHLANALQATNVVARVARDTIAAVDRLYPREVGDAAPDDAAPDDAAPADTRWHDVRSSATGYLQAVDGEALLRLAEERDVVVRLLPAVGDFVVEGEPVLSTSSGAPDPAFERRLRATLVVAEARTVEQDAAYGLRQLVDIALRALSPGVNDTTTATTCVDHLGAVLVRLGRRRIASTRRARDGRLRLVTSGPTFASLVALAVDELRQSAASNVAAMARVLALLTRVAAATPVHARRRVLADHAERVLAASLAHAVDPHDRATLECLAGAARRAAERATDPRR